MKGGSVLQTGKQRSDCTLSSRAKEKDQETIGARRCRAGPCPTTEQAGGACCPAQGRAGLPAATGTSPRPPLAA